MKTALLVTICAAAFLIIASCRADQRLVISHTAISHFHAQYNEGNFRAIWDEGTADLRNQGTGEGFAQFLQTIKTEAGNADSSITIAYYFSNASDKPARVKLRQETSFAKKKLTEYFTFDIIDDKALLTGYHLDSRDSLLK